MFAIRTKKKSSQTFLNNMKENILFVFRLFFANLLSLSVISTFRRNW